MCHRLGRRRDTGLAQTPAATAMAKKPIPKRKQLNGAPTGARVSGASLKLVPRRREILLKLRELVAAGASPWNDYVGLSITKMEFAR